MSQLRSTYKNRCRSYGIKPRNFDPPYLISGLKAVHLPILLDLIYQNLPAGIKISVGKTDKTLDEDRFVPQLEREALEKELSKLKV
ncbi:unnamed protein product [Trichobilharzia regenti]|nr:unnamed protein product [Trichobilharzia regenti]